MPTFSWTDDLNTGNAFIDEDHRKLMQMINAMLDAMAKGQANDLLSKVLHNLIIYTRGHFDREEAEMLRIQYPAYASHKAEHTHLIQEVMELKAQMDAGEKISATAVYNFLSNWLRTHILKVDMQLARALRK